VVVFHAKPAYPPSAFAGEDIMGWIEIEFPVEYPCRWVGGILAGNDGVLGVKRAIKM
jgi:hypothetical protein